MSFLDLEQLLVERLTAQLPSTVRVFSASDLASVPTNSQVAPAVQIIYGGYRVVELKNDKRSAKVKQTWYVVPVVRNVAGQIDGRGARTSASDLIDQTLDALMGWRPSDAFTFLELASSVPPRWIKGLGYHPLAFETNTAAGTSLPRN